MIREKSFDRVLATMLTVHRARHDDELSPSVRAHRTKNDILVMDFERPSVIFDWRHITMRDVLLENKVKHMAIARAPWVRGTRVVGIPLCSDDSRKPLHVERVIREEGKKDKKVIVEISEPLVDIRMTFNAHDVDYESFHGEFPAIPDIEVREDDKRRGNFLLRFAYPIDLREQVAALYVPPYFQDTLK